MDDAGQVKQRVRPPLGQIVVWAGSLSLAFVAALLVLRFFIQLPWLQTLSIGFLFAVFAAAGVYYHFAIRDLLIAWLSARTEPSQTLSRNTAVERALGYYDRDLAAKLANVDRLWHDYVADFQQSERLQRAIFDTIPEPLILLDTRARVQAANRAAYERFGKRILGFDIHQILRQPAASSLISKVLKNGGSEIIEFETTSISRHFFALHVDSYRVDDGSPRAALLLFTDLTDLKRAEQMRGDFIANASHELRTPLASMIGFIETLQGPAKEDDEAREQFLDIMRAQAGRMSRLVEDLLSLSRIESIEHTRPTDAISLPAVLESVRVGLAIAAQRQNITLSLACEPDLPAVRGDGDQIAQVAQNLVENAIKYGRPDSVVTIHAYQPSRVPLAFPDTDIRVVSFAVSDQGQGIPESDLPRLTERFYRVDTARSRELGGTGLGLAIVKHIVTRHRGALSVESELGVGSTFTVTLPQFMTPKDTSPVVNRP